MSAMMGAKLFPKAASPLKVGNKESAAGSFQDLMKNFSKPGGGGL